MRFGEPTGPRFHPVDFGLKSFKRGGLPMLSHATKWQRLRFAVDANKASQIIVPFVQPPRETSGAYSPGTFNVGQPSRQHFLDGLIYDKPCGHHLGFSVTHSMDIIAQQSGSCLFQKSAPTIDSAGRRVASLKYFPFRIGQIISTSRAVPRLPGGRFAIVTDVGCGMRWARPRT
jgi:hypothetical protein